MLAIENIREAQEKGLCVDSGDFAENITTEGLALWKLPVGKKLRLGENVLLEVTQEGNHDAQNQAGPERQIIATVTSYERCQTQRHPQNNSYPVHIPNSFQSFYGSSSVRCVVPASDVSPFIECGELKSSVSCADDHVLSIPCT